MKPLKKSYEVSEENVHVKIGGKIYRCANLKKSGIIIKSKILVAHEDVWHEVDIIGIGKDEKSAGLENSNLYNFKNMVEQKNLSPSFLNFNVESSVKDYELTHDERMSLDASYGFSYVYIEKLEKHLARFGHKTGMHEVKSTLNYIKKSGRTIQEYIEAECAQANEIINNSNKLVKMGENKEIRQTERIDFLLSLGFVWDDQENAYVCRYGTAESPARFEVSLRSIEDDEEENWSNLVERIEFSVPAIEQSTQAETTEFSPTVQEAENPDSEALPATPISETTQVKKPVSLETIGNLSPDRITEFTTIQITQEKVIKDNPYIEIKTKEDYTKAKKHVSNLLKASTAIDSPTNGVKALKNKYIKQFSTVLDTFLDSMSGMTRKAHDKQKLQVTKWESEEALRIQREQKAEMEKIKTRTDLLFAVPMTFNGEHYSIGTLYILPSQIKDLSDEEFNALVAQANGIKAGLDAAALANADKDKQIAELKAMLEKLTGTTVPVEAPAPVQTETIEKTIQPGPTSTGTAPLKSPVSAPAPQQTAQSGEFVYNAPDENNKLLLAFDLENLQHVEKQAFLKCRSYFIAGLKASGAEIEAIFSNTAIEKKAGPLKELGTILKNS